MKATSTWEMPETGHLAYRIRYSRNRCGYEIHAVHNISLSLTCSPPSIHYRNDVGNLAMLRGDYEGAIEVL